MTSRKTAKASGAVSAMQGGKQIQIAVDYKGNVVTTAQQ